MASRSLDDLAPLVKRRAVAMVERCRAQGFDVLIYCTLRSLAAQARLYAMGRTQPGRIVTNARPGESLHNPDQLGYAWAFDAVPLVGGKAQWDDAGLIGRMGEVGEAEGLEWAGRWSGPIRESVHFQVRGGIYGPGNGKAGAEKAGRVVG